MAHGRVPKAAVAILAMVWTVALVPASTPAAAPPPRSVTHSIRTMGTYDSLTVVTGDSAATSPDARTAAAVFFRVDSLLSNWTETSEVARVNRVAALGPTPVHPELAAVLAASLRAWRETGGAFDITVEPLVRLWGFLGGKRRVPSDAEIAATLPRVGAARVHLDLERRTVRFADPGVRIDLGGIAKGYAVDVAAETLAARGVANALVDLSGNMVALGHAPAASGWRIGIRDPRDRVRYFARFVLGDREAISTSGQYQQFVAEGGRIVRPARSTRAAAGHDALRRRRHREDRNVSTGHTIPARDSESGSIFASRSR